MVQSITCVFTEVDNLSYVIGYSGNTKGINLSPLNLSGFIAGLDCANFDIRHQPL
jgi:hypothetical protein